MIAKSFSIYFNMPDISLRSCAARPLHVKPEIDFPTILCNVAFSQPFVCAGLDERKQASKLVACLLAISELQLF